jgi:hypothetical protein
MKLRVKRLVKYTFDNVTTHQTPPGEYNVPKDVSEQAAILMIQHGAAVWITAPIKVAPKKVAPENKVVKVEKNKVGPLVVPENKTSKRKKKVRRKK